MKIIYIATSIFALINVSYSAQDTIRIAKQENLAGIEWVLVKGGTFDMGDNLSDGEANERPVHRVKVSDFYFGKTEVTVGQFSKFVEATKYVTEAEVQGWAYGWTGSAWVKVDGASWRKPGFAQTDEHPVVDVSWNDAVAFCKWAGGRLSTEAEWEYACRAGTVISIIKSPALS